MYPELKQELYKLNHRKLPWVLIGLLVVLMIIMGLAMGRTYSSLMQRSRSRAAVFFAKFLTLFFYNVVCMSPPCLSPSC